MKRIYTGTEVSKILRVKDGWQIPKYTKTTKFILEEIPLSKIENDIECAVEGYDRLVKYPDARRNFDDWAYVRRLAELIESGVRLPPIVVTDKYGILDGFHRATAARVAGQLTIEVFRRL